MANRIEIIIDSVTHGLEKGLKKSEHGLAKFGLAAVAGGAALATGLAVGLEKSIHAALNAEKVNARLAQTFKNVGLSATRYKDQVEALDSAGRKLGFTDEDTKTSLGSLLVATHNMAKASKDLGVAQDIARFKGVGLNDATKMLSMAMTGSQRAAKQLGITVPPVTAAFDALGKKASDAAKAHAKFIDKQATGQAVIDAVSAKVQGQAKAFSMTASGGMEQFRAQLEHIEVAIGEKLLPAITAAIGYISAHWPEISATIQQAWNQIRPTLVSLGQLIQSIVLLIRKEWPTIGPIVKQVANTIKVGLEVVAGVIRVVAALLRGDWSGAWTAAKAVAAGVVAYFRSEIRTGLLVLEAAAHAAESGVQALVGALKNALAWAAHRIPIPPGLKELARAFETVYGWIAATIHAVEGLISALGRIHVPSIHLPHIGVPHLAGGTKSFSGGMALVGEKGPELVNLPGGSSVTPNGAMGGTIVFNFPNYVGDKRELMDVIRAEAQIFRQRTGRPAFS